MQTPLHGKDLLPAAGEYTVEVMAAALLKFVQRHLPRHPVDAAKAWLDGIRTRRDAAAQALSAPLPPRPPGFCIGCPERPVFSALKLAQAEVGRVHIAADIGCHAFGTFEPFGFGHSILGYGMSLASRAGVSPMMARRTLAIVGDGGFWHNGLLTGVQSALFNGDDAVLLIFKNGYTSATGTQEIISTPDDEARDAATDPRVSLVDKNTTIERTLGGLGVRWLRTVHTYEVETMRRTLIEALTSDFNGLKVIVAEGECQLERQRRLRPWIAVAAAARRTCGAHQVRRRRRGVQRRPCLHPPVGLPDVDLEGQPRSAEGRPGGHRDRRLRRLRAVRLQRACRHLVPELLPRRGGAATRAGTSACWRACAVRCGGCWCRR